MSEREKGREWARVRERDGQRKIMSVRQREPEWMWLCEKEWVKKHKCERRGVKSVNTRERQTVCSFLCVHTHLVNISALHIWLRLIAAQRGGEVCKIFMPSICCPSPSTESRPPPSEQSCAPAQSGSHPQRCHQCQSAPPQSPFSYWQGAYGVNSLISNLLHDEKKKNSSCQNQFSTKKQSAACLEAGTNGLLPWQHDHQVGYANYI